MAGKSSIVLVALLLVLLESCHCDQNLINQTCKKTPFPALCASSLGSDRRSAAADLQGLGVIMVDVIKAKATATQNQIKALLGGNPTPQLKQALTSCLQKYMVIITADVPSASEAVSKGAFKFGVDATNDAATEANSCESGFGGKSPISGLNKNTHDVSVVALAIVRMLM